MEHRDSQSAHIDFDVEGAEDGVDPLLCSSRSSIANVLQAARASLKNPSRPYTPRDSSRKLFTGNDYLRRPDSSYGLPSSKSFLESSQTTRPQGNLPPLGPIPSGSQTRGGSAGARGTSPFRERLTNRAPPRGTRPSSPSPPPLAQPQVLVVHHPDQEEPAPTAMSAVGGDARSVVRVHSADSVTRPGPPPPPGVKPASARAASPARVRMERASSLQREPASHDHHRPPTDAPPVQPVPLHPDPRKLSTPRTPSLRQSGVGLPVGGSKPTAAYRAQLDRQLLQAEEAGRAVIHQDHPCHPGNDSALTMEEMSECQDDIVAGGSLVRDEAHEAWCAEVEETIDGMAHSLAALAKSRPPLQQHAADVAEALDRLRSLVAAAWERSEDGVWLSCAAAGSMAAVTPRESVLHQVFRVMDCGEPALLIKACTVTLHVAQDPGPLRNAFKALFKLSKDARNDAGFRRERTLAALLRALGRNSLSTEALVYAAGTLKNASTDPANQRVLLEEGAVPALVRMLSERCARDGERATSARPTSASGRPRSASNRPASAGRPASGADEAAQLAVQLTGTLRNIAVMSHAAAQFAESRAVQVFAALIGGFVRHSELMLNVARIVAKLSADHASLRDMSKDEEFVRQLLELLRVHPDHAPLVLRVTFLLGNLTVNNNRNRLTIGQKFGGADLFVALLDRYTWKRPSSASSTPPATASSSRSNNSDTSQSQSLGRAGDAAESAGATEAPASDSHMAKPRGSDKSRVKADSESDAQVLVKLVRLVANLAIHPQLGPEIARMGTCASALQELLQKHSDQGSADSAELVLNVVSAITNLLFYEVEDNAVLGLRASAPRYLTPLLLSDNPEAQVEAARAFGNFSRHPEVRDYMASARVVEAMCLLLDHSNRDVLYSVCGVLMNFTSDQAHLSLLAEADGVSMLIDLLGRALLEGDLPLGTLVCKTLCNLCSTPRQGFEDVDIPPPLFTGPDVHELTHTLTRAKSHYQAKASKATGGPATKEPEHAARVEEAMEASEFAELASRLCTAVQNAPVMCNDDERDGSDGAGDLEPLEGPVRPIV